MAELSVSDGELRRLEVVRDVDRAGLPVRAAAQLLGRSERRAAVVGRVLRYAWAPRPPATRPQRTDIFKLDSPDICKLRGHFPRTRKFLGAADKMKQCGASLSPDFAVAAVREIRAAL
jgi:hypothetical protein